MTVTDDRSPTAGSSARDPSRGGCSIIASTAQRARRTTRSVMSGNAQAAPTCLRVPPMTMRSVFNAAAKATRRSDAEPLMTSSLHWQRVRRSCGSHA